VTPGGAAGAATHVCRRTPGAGHRVYLASPLGFTAPGREWNRTVLLPAVRAAGLDPADPWRSSPESAQLEAALRLPRGPARTVALAAADRVVGAANIADIDASCGVLALLDGDDADSGTSAELGYAAARGLVVVGLRTDLRPGGDNEGVPVNLQLVAFIEHTGGAVVADLGNALGILRHRLDGTAAVAGGSRTA
jgi:nucleoside 2-deoxyribosyltransferase